MFAAIGFKNDIWPHLRPRVLVPSVMVPHGRVVAVLVRGDSMLGDGLHDGDYVIVNRDQSPKDKDIVVVRTGGQADSEAMVKRIRLKRNGTLLRLESSNPDSPEEVVEPEENPQVEGTVIGIFRGVTRRDARIAGSQV